METLYTLDEGDVYKICYLVSKGWKYCVYAKAWKKEGHVYTYRHCYGQETLSEDFPDFSSAYESQEASESV